MAENEENKRKLPFGYKTIVFVIAVAFGLSLLALRPPFIDKFALGFDNIKYSVRSAFGATPKPSDKVVIVTVDEKSVNRLGRWPWRREVIAELFEKMNTAAIVSLDIVFSESTNEEEDYLLGDTIYDNGNVITGFFFRDEATEETDEQDLIYLEDCAFLRFELKDDVVGLKEFSHAEVNIPIIADSGLTCAFFTTQPDVDGLYRRYPVAYIFRGSIFPSMAVQTLRYFLNKDAFIVLDKDGVDSFTMDDIHFKDTNYFLLNYYEPESVEYISASDVIDGTVDPSVFTDRIVVVGVTEIGIFDMRPTPMDPVTPGVSLHYTAISNMLENHILKRAHLLSNMLIIVGLALAFFVGGRKVMYFRIAMYLMLLLAVFGFSQWMFIGLNLWVREFYALITMLLFITAIEAYNFIGIELRAMELKKAFSNYVSGDLVDEIMKDPDKLELGGQEREVTVLFSDIRGFTTLSETLSPTQLVYVLTELLDPMTNVILAKRGMLDKYIGDAMMALFNAPLELPNHADMACESALELVQVLGVVNAKFKKQGLPVVDVGVGINTGVAVVGNMGSKVRFEYTAIGDNVNLASRLEGLCKMYKAHIIISEYTYKALSGSTMTRALDLVTVKGKERPVRIYEVLEDTADNAIMAERYEAAMMFYSSRDFERARLLFMENIEEHRDPSSAIFAKRCEMFIQNPPATDWDGVFRLKTK